MPRNEYEPPKISQIILLMALGVVGMAATMTLHFLDGVFLLGKEVDWRAYFLVGVACGIPVLVWMFIVLRFSRPPGT